MEKCHVQKINKNICLTKKKEKKRTKDEKKKTTKNKAGRRGGSCGTGAARGCRTPPGAAHRLPPPSGNPPVLLFWGEERERTRVAWPGAIARAWRRGGGAGLQGDLQIWGGGATAGEGAGVASRCQRPPHPTPRGKPPHAPPGPGRGRKPRIWGSVSLAPPPASLLGGRKVSRRLFLASVPPFSSR